MWSDLFLLPFLTGLGLALVLPVLGCFLRLRDEWLAALADPLLAQSAIDRLQSSTWELVVEGESYRRRQKPTLNRQEVASEEARR